MFPSKKELSAIIAALFVLALFSCSLPLPVGAGGPVPDYVTQSEVGTIVSQDANAVAITGGSITGITDLAVADGGTGASTASGARINLGLPLYMAYVSNTADGAVPTAEWTIATFPTEVYDTNGNFAANAYTVPVTGVYSSRATVFWQSVAGGNVYTVEMFVNGTFISPRFSHTKATDGTTSSHTLAGNMFLTAGQVVTVMLYQNSGSPVTAYGNPSASWLIMLEHPL